ncbi:MAG TPA: TonB family protein [Blastocatellia bacterium]
MKSAGKRLLSPVCAFAMVANSLSAVMAQDRKGDGPSVAIKAEVAIASTIDTRVQEAINRGYANAAQQGGDSVFQFFSQELSFDNRLVTSAPFSAEIVSETIQTLLDGNRIVQRSEGRIFRDSEGRTRSERTYQMGGTSEQKQTITIYDPVANVNSILDPEARTVRKTPFFFSQPGRGPIGLDGVVTLVNPDNSAGAKKIPMAHGILQGGAVKTVQPPYPSLARAVGVEGSVQVRVLIGETGEVIKATVISGHPLLRAAALEAARQWQFKPTEVSAKVVKVEGVLTFNFTLVNNENQASVEAAKRATKYSTNREQLGKRMVEGVECEGTRTVTTIPIGAIGNERPLEMVGETWFSPELKMIILSKRSDPRFGESTYRVTNISRSEPETTLFQVPSDYAVKDGGFVFTSASDTEIKSDVKIEIKSRKPDNQ